MFIARDDPVRSLRAARNEKATPDPISRGARHRRRRRRRRRRTSLIVWRKLRLRRKRSRDYVKFENGAAGNASIRAVYQEQAIYYVNIIRRFLVAAVFILGKFSKKNNKKLKKKVFPVNFALLPLITGVTVPMMTDAYFRYGDPGGAS